MNELKYHTKIKNGQLDLPPLDLPEGTIVEAILLIKDETLTEDDVIDETDYLLSTSANREHLEEAVDLLKDPQNYIYVDPTQL